MISRTMSGLLVALAACMLASCGEDAPAPGGKPAEHEEGHPHRDHGAHGGHLIEVGDHAAHVEFLHDPKAGTVTLHVGTGKDPNTPLKLTHAPDLKLLTKQGPKVLPTRPVGGDAHGASQFQVSDPLLQTDRLRGRIALEIGGKVYNPELEKAH